ncbi:MAG: SurA N-terminal domain-containing protein [Sphingomonadales bacterium]|nr:SurA N-terminal domain-containing protein [Sphingomonadales bacterium]
MISFFRRALSSWVVLGSLLALIMIAFIVTGVGTLSGLDNLSGGGSNLAKVGGSTISSTDAAARVSGTARRRPSAKSELLEIGTFVCSGGVDEVVDQMVNGRASEQFGLKYGITTVSSRLVDGEIAAIPAFLGPSAWLDRNTFLGVLAQRKLNERIVREDLARDKMTNALILPAAGVARVPVGLVTPTAALLLEPRTGQIGLVLTAAIVSGAASVRRRILQKFYQRQLIPLHRAGNVRIIPDAPSDRSRFEGKASATEAEIAQACYKAAVPVQYAAMKPGSLLWSVRPTQAVAAQIAVHVCSGIALSAAGKGVGSGSHNSGRAGPVGLCGIGCVSPLLPRRHLVAAKGAILDPQKSPLGWLVVQVDAINRTGGYRSLMSVRHRQRKS